MYGLGDSWTAWAIKKELNHIKHLKSGIRSGRGRPSTGFSFRFNKVVIYKPVLNYELNTVNGMTGRYFGRIGRNIVRDAKRQVGVKTGALRDSIHMRHLANYTGQYLWIGSTKNYAYIHHEGTKPHLITPNPPNKVLVFGKGSRIVHTQMVKHPGTRPNRYLSDQLRVHVRR